MDDSTKGLTSSERFESAIMSRAEPSRAEPSRAEPSRSRAEPSRAEPSRAEPSRAEPSRAEPSRAEPSRAEPSRAEPSRAEPSRAEPSRAEPSRAEPSRAEPSRAEPSRAEPSRAEPSRAEPSRAEPLSPPRARECCYPPPPDRLPPRRGGRPSSKTASAAGRPASFARLANARRALVRSARAVAAVACLCLAGPLALPAQAQTTNFYLWRTTITVGVLDNSSVDYTNIISGYASVLSLGSISTDADFGYPPWNPPHKHHFDPDNQISVAAVTIVQVGSSKTIRLQTMPSLSDVGTVTLWIGHKSYPLSSPSSTGTDFVEWNTDLDREEDDEVGVVLSYERRLPSAPKNVSVTAPPGEDGTLEVSWDEPGRRGHLSHRVLPRRIPPPER